MLHLTKNSYHKFSGGEVHVKMNDEDIYHESTICVTDYSMDGLMALAQMVEILNRQNRYNLNIDLIYPYLPYARQDRVMVPSESFSLQLFCSFINAMNFKSVTVMDCHSDVALGMLKRVVNLPQWDIAKEVLPAKFFPNEGFVFVSPDAGAYKKVAKLVPDDNRIAIGVKQRSNTGEITGTRVFSPVDLKGKHCIIVDDICDGGRTFIELTKALKEQGAAKVYLYVTHGIFSKGLLPLKDAGIEHIYTTDSFQQTKDNFLTVKEL